MTQEQIDDLLVEWEIARQQGRELTPDELAPNSPELQDKIRARISALKATSWMVDETLDEENWGGVASVASVFDVPTQTLSNIVTGLNSIGFMEALIASGILTDGDVGWIDRLVAEHGAHLEPKELAERLVEQKVLTQYQASVLLAQRRAPLVLDRYIVLEPIGAGGMGLVYKALHRSMHRVVALKVLPPHAMDSPSKVARFRREIMAAARLSHPNIVAAYDAHEADGMHFLVMEYVAGDDLKKTVLENGPLPFEEATRIVFLIASALEEAHRQEIVHRDVKPSNILLAEDGTPKLLDLGLAQIKATIAQESSNQLTRDGIALGTAAYMSPEQAASPTDVDDRSDIYSLGCTLYFLIGGKPPYDCTSSLETLRAHVNQPTPRLRDANPEVSDALEHVFQKMVAKRPADRYASMHHVCDAMIANGLVDGQTMGAAGEFRTVDERTLPQRQRSTGRWIAALSAAAVVWVAVLLVVLGRSGSAMTDRQVAAWAIAQGGVVTAETPLGEQVFDNLDDLPEGNIRVVSIELPGADKPLSLAPLDELEQLRTLRLRDFSDASLPLDELPQLGELKQLALTDCGVRDDDIAVLAKLDELEALDLSDNELTNAALPSLASLSRLKQLRLDGTAVNDLGLGHLAMLPQLASLSLARCTITDQGTTALAQIAGLETLVLDGTDVGDTGLSNLVALAKLRHLELADTRISVAGLAALKDFAALRHVSVSGIAVSPDLVGVLRSLPQLESLELSGPEVTDERLERLSMLNQLRRLTLTDTSTTATARAQLAQQMPACDILVP